MAQDQITYCDSDICGKDITKGDGRNWRLDIYPVVISMQGEPKHDATTPPQAKHFCDEKCLADWATPAAKEKAEDEAQFQAKVKRRNEQRAQSKAKKST